MSTSEEINQGKVLDSFNYFKSSFIEKALKEKVSKKVATKLIILGKKLSDSKLKQLVPGVMTRQFDEFMSSSAKSFKFATEDQDVWIIDLSKISVEFEQETHQKLIGESQYMLTRDSVGEWFKQNLKSKMHLSVHFVGLDENQENGVLVGLEMSQYEFKKTMEKSDLVKLTFYKNDKALNYKDLKKGASLGVGVNLARHLVNIPPSILNPQNYLKTVKTLFKNSSTLTVQSWGRERLKKEKMGLLLAVGQGSGSGPLMIHIKMRSAAKKVKPKAFVGKGITFDTGGLDLKPSSFMRLMKKDMGGSAAVVGFAYYCLLAGLKVNTDFYLAVAENLVAKDSFKPSDIIEARNGISVEVDNTDAEGRLAMADVLDVAVTQKEKPEYVIDVATLTGAIKVGLGTRLAGMFSNDEKLSKQLEKSAYENGDLVWRMPLVQAYRKSLKTPFADMLNCGDRFGGAITAALFLESFIGDTPWAHVDIFAWQGGSGVFKESGGSGQAVQLLSGLV